MSDSDGGDGSLPRHGYYRWYYPDKNAEKMLFMVFPEDPDPEAIQ
jgi:hypothetical protein